MNRVAQLADVQEYVLAHLTRAGHVGPNDESMPVVLDEPFVRIGAERKWELLDMLRDTHRILLRFEETMDRLDKLAQSWDEKISSVDMSPERFARLEQALFNIERGMTGVEASVGALPRALRSRIDRGRRPTAGESPPTPRRPF